MGELRISMAIEGADRYRALAKKLREPAKKKLRADLRAQINEAGKPILDEVRERVRTLPVTSHGGGTAQRRSFNVSKARTERAVKNATKRPAGLRETIAKATKIKITAKGIQFVVASSALPADQVSLPRHLDSAKGWRHPVFGNKSNWVSQKGQPWFASTISKRAPQFRRAALNAIDQTIQELER
jgi:hypothetical protein